MLPVDFLILLVRSSYLGYLGGGGGGGEVRFTLSLHHPKQIAIAQKL